MIEQSTPDTGPIRFHNGVALLLFRRGRTSVGAGVVVLGIVRCVVVGTVPTTTLWSRITWWTTNTGIQQQYGTNDRTGAENDIHRRRVGVIRTRGRVVDFHPGTRLGGDDAHISTKVVVVVLQEQPFDLITGQNGHSHPIRFGMVRW